MDLDATARRVAIEMSDGSAPASRIGYGTSPRLNPAGTLIAYFGETEITVVDLIGKVQRHWPEASILSAVPGETLATARALFWTRMGDRLAILTALRPAFDDAIVSRPPSPLPPRPSHVVVINSDTGAVEQVLKGPTAFGFSAVGAGPDRDSVLIASNTSLVDQPEELSSLNLRSGSLDAIAGFPAGDHVAAIDGSGNFVIYQDGSHTWYWRGITARLAPTHIADDLMTASW